MRPKGELRPQARIEACKVPLRTTAPKGDAALSAQLSPFSFQTMLCAPRAGAAVASRVAVGGAAAAPVSVGANADAGLVITEATKMQDVAAYLTANCPGLCPALRWLLSLGAA